MAKLERPSRPVNLSAQDIDYIARVVATEVPPGIAKRNPLEYKRMVGAVVDTITNRVASGRYGGSVTDVLNQRRAFSKITGPKRLDPHGSVEKTPKAPKAVMEVVKGHIAARADGMPSIVGGALDYANPNYSDASNRRRWVDPMIKSGAQKFGLGNSVHYHGLAPGNREAPMTDIDAPLPSIDPGKMYRSYRDPVPTQKPNDYQRFADGMRSQGLLGLDGRADLQAPISPVERGAPLSPALTPAAAPVPVSRNYPQLGGTRIALAPTPGSRLAPAPASRLGPAAAPRIQPNPEPEPVQASNFTLGNPGMGLADQYATYGAGKLGMPTPAPPLSPPTVVNPPPQIFDLPVPAPYNPLQAAIDSAPGPQPNVPRGSQAAYDFYNGQNDQAFASTGEALNRDRYGNTYITNKFGVTTGTGPLGNSFRASSIPGPIGDQQQANGGILGADWDKIGQKAKPALGGALGAGLGGLLGPVGATLGGAIGRELAKPGGGRVGDFLRDTRTVDTSKVPGTGSTSRFARPQSGGPFPAAPKGGGLGATKYSSRDYDRMEKMSPQATKTIREGGGGLY